MRSRCGRIVEEPKIESRRVGVSHSKTEQSPSSALDDFGHGCANVVVDCAVCEFCKKIVLLCARRAAVAKWQNKSSVLVAKRFDPACPVNQRRRCFRYPCRIILGHVAACSSRGRHLSRAFRLSQFSAFCGSKQTRSVRARAPLFWRDTESSYRTAGLLVERSTRSVEASLSPFCLDKQSPRLR